MQFPHCDNLAEAIARPVRPPSQARPPIAVRLRELRPVVVPVLAGGLSRRSFAGVRSCSRFIVASNRCKLQLMTRPLRVEIAVDIDHVMLRKLAVLIGDGPS